jgi:hypothetical protein
MDVLGRETISRLGSMEAPISGGASRSKSVFKPLILFIGGETEA